MASIQDVAKRAQVGTATVSRVLSGKGYVARETRSRVLRAVEELQYVPNELARNLLRNRTQTVAVIVPDMLNPFFSTFVDEAGMALRQAGYKTLICSTMDEERNELLYLDMLKRNMVDGIISASHLLDSRHYDHIDRPVVMIDRVVGADVPAVCTDHVEGGRQAARLLIEAGCRHVVQFRDSLDVVQERAILEGKYLGEELPDFPFTLRHIEFARTARQAGLQCDSCTVVWDDGHFSDYRQLRERVLRAFASFHGVDGVLATDNIAVTIQRLALSGHPAVPRDLKIVSYDGTYLMDLCYPPMTYIEQPVPALARKSVELLLKQINGEKIDAMRVILPVSVVRGQSA